MHYPDPKFKSAVIYKFDGKIQGVDFSYFTAGKNNYFTNNLYCIQRVETNGAKWLQELKEEVIRDLGKVSLKPLIIGSNSIKEIYLNDFDKRIFEIYKPNTRHRKLTPDDEFYFMYKEFGEDVDPPVLFNTWSFDECADPLQARLKYCKLESKREELIAIAEKVVKSGKTISDEDVLNALLQMKNILCPNYKPKYNYKIGEGVVRYNKLKINGFYGEYIDDFGEESPTVHFKNVVMAEIAASCLNRAVSKTKSKVK